jgi:Bifunctional DNA primase/polymerase, N-terminal
MTPRPRPADDDWTVTEAGLWYAANGFPVFPVHCAPNGRCSCGESDCEHPGKHPHTRNGFKDATTDREQIVRWWRDWPDANIAIPTGKVSGLLVVDIDPRNGGNESWDSFIAKHGPSPPTAEQLSGGGGRHIAFSDPGVRAPKELAPGIDVKSAGGYIIVAPSIHASGGLYAWYSIEGAKALLNLAPAPAWLVECFAAKLQDNRATPNEDGKKWKPGERNNKLTSLAGTMRRGGMLRESIEVALLEENRRRSEPPWRRRKYGELQGALHGIHPPRKRRELRWRGSGQNRYLLPTRFQT